jgi:hypothetical protein
MLWFRLPARVPPGRDGGVRECTEIPGLLSLWV